MLTFGFGINTDVDHIAFAALDSDQTAESRVYLNGFRGSPYFVEHAPIAEHDAAGTSHGQRRASVCDRGASRLRA